MQPAAHPLQPSKLKAEQPLQHRKLQAHLRVETSTLRMSASLATVTWSDAATNTCGTAQYGSTVQQGQQVVEWASRAAMRARCTFIGIMLQPDGSGAG
jgi:hypothetical protein